LLGVVTNEVWQHDVHTFAHARICEHALRLTKRMFNVPLLGLSGTSRKET